MKKALVLFFAGLVGFNVYAVDGKQIFDSKCVSCHGSKGEKKALGTGNVLKGQTAAEIEKKLLGYKNGSYGGSKKNIMKTNADKLSNDEIKAVSLYIESLK